MKLLGLSTLYNLMSFTVSHLKIVLNHTRVTAANMDIIIIMAYQFNTVSVA